MTKHDCIGPLVRAGIDYDDAHALRRIAMTLHRWAEYECGTGDGQTTYSIERDGDEPDSKPYMRVQYPTRDGYVDKRWPIADRETGALRRLAKIMAKYPAFRAYHQGDPRGASLWILRTGDLRDGQTPDVGYTNGLAVYR